MFKKDIYKEDERRLDSSVKGLDTENKEDNNIQSLRFSVGSSLAICTQFTGYGFDSSFILRFNSVNVRFIGGVLSLQRFSFWR